MNCTVPDLNTSAFHRRILSQMNEAMAVQLMPAILYAGVLLVVGLVGNILVCYVYSFRLRMGTQNFLIVCLAVFDLMSCVFLIPTEIADMSLPYMFDNETACRLLRFLGYCSVFASILTLLVIAFDRFRKICRPSSRQISLGSVKIAIAVVSVVAMVFAVFSGVVNGASLIETTEPGICGYSCTTSDAMKPTVFPLLHNAFLLVSFCATLLTLSVVYFRIWLELRRHNRYMVRRASCWAPMADVTDPENQSGAGITRQVTSHAQKSPSLLGEARKTRSHLGVRDNLAANTGCELRPQSCVPQYSNHVTYCLQSDNGLDHDVLADVKHKSSVTDESVHVPTDTTKHNSDVTDDAVHVHDDTVKYTCDVTEDTEHITHDVMKHKGGVTSFKQSPFSAGSRRKPSMPTAVRAVESRKTTSIAFAVTAVFFLSFLPHLALGVVTAVVQDFDKSLQGASLVIYNIFRRSYMIQSASNAFIYGVLNRHFRFECQALLYRLFTCASAPQPPQQQPDRHSSTAATNESHSAQHLGLYDRNPNRTAPGPS